VPNAASALRDAVIAPRMSASLFWRIPMAIADVECPHRPAERHPVVPE
jgi:hypothetical protein